MRSFHLSLCHVTYSPPSLPAASLTPSRSCLSLFRDIWIDRCHGDSQNERHLEKQEIHFLCTHRLVEFSCISAPENSVFVFWGKDFGDGFFWPAADIEVGARTFMLIFIGLKTDQKKGNVTLFIRKAKLIGKGYFWGKNNNVSNMIEIFLFLFFKWIWKCINNYPDFLTLKRQEVCRKNGRKLLDAFSNGANLKL